MSKCCNLQFADDWCIAYSSDSIEETLEALRRGMKELANWLKSTGLGVAIDKTKFMFFNNRTPLIRNLILEIEGSEIQQSDKAKFLGVWFDTKMTWNKHIAEIISRSRFALNVLRALSGTKCGKHPNHLINVHKGYILPNIEWGVQCYGNATHTVLKKLDTLQFEALRICLGLLKCTDIASLLKIADVMPPEAKRTQIMYRYLLRSSAVRDLRIWERIQKLYEFRGRKKKTMPFTLKAFEKLRDKIDRMNRYELPLCYNFPINCQIKKFLSNLKFGLTLDNPTEDEVEREIERNFAEYCKIYTDASKDTDESMGATVFDSSNRKVARSKLYGENSVLEAELFAILKSLIRLDQEYKESGSFFGL